jgi:ABC-type transporter Mla MlaB component
MCPCSPVPFEVRLSWAGEKIWLALTGDLTLVVVGRLIRCVDDMIEMWPASTTIRVDLSRLISVDAIGLRVLAAACQRLEGTTRSLQVYGLNEDIRRRATAAKVDIAGATRAAPRRTEREGTIRRTECR